MCESFLAVLECLSPENPLFCHRPVDVHIYVHAVLRQHLVVGYLSTLARDQRRTEML